ncbi:hypothetical protein I6I07_14745 [Achromobacter deleyi]|uniref:Uncharacterized protein n=1 Tax=Achromobacter deleyi TaxID=1353891 RepID=A0A7T4B911_9BURK|nr:hypothetical protein [Achromobacter deleyi]QQB37757.1 hypothetical protein I6I07_14745 [Achromobacter deleyi]
MQDRDFKTGEAVSPVTGWAMMPLVEHDSLLLRLDFLNDPSPAAATRSERGRVYAVTSEQLQLLLDSLQAQLDKLQPGQGGSRH